MSLEAWLAEHVPGRRVAVLTNDAARDGGGVTTLARVRAAGPAVLRRLAPEHGLSAALPPGETDAAGEDVVPFHSAVRGAPDPAVPESDHYLYDVPLVGARYFTHLDGLRRLMAVAGRAGRPVAVVDRGNPLGSLREGPGVCPELRSDVAGLDVPVRYGATTGEVARGIAGAAGFPEPAILGAPAPGRDFVPPSPNLREAGAVALYPATCLLEAFEVSEGRGTPRPFLRVGAPGLDGRDLLGRLDLPAGVVATPVDFTPRGAGRVPGRPCGGVDLEVDPGSLPLGPVLPFGLSLLEGMRALLGEALVPVRDPGGTYWLDRLWGTPALGRALDAGTDLREVATGAGPPGEDHGWSPRGPHPTGTETQAGGTGA